MINTTTIILAIASFFIMIAGTGYPMSRFNLCLFSEVEGIVLDHGKPVVGAELERTWDLGYDESTGSDRTTTDDKGYFRFPKITKFYILPGLLPFMQPVIAQTINIHSEGKIVEAWMTSKWDYKEDSELGKQIRIICHLDREPGFTDIPSRPSGAVWGVCEFVDGI